MYGTYSRLKNTLNDAVRPGADLLALGAQAAWLGTRFRVASQLLNCLHGDRDSGD